MFERIISQMRQLVLESQYVVTLHAYDEMVADNFNIWDIESAILNGTILERQRDQTTSERKYRLNGIALDKRKLEVVLKIGFSGKLVIITVYAQ